MYLEAKRTKKLSSTRSALEAIAGASSREAADTNLANHKPLAATVRAAKGLVIYEGLPHQTFQRKLLEKELKTKKTVQLHGFPFYADPQEPRKADAAALRKLLSSRASVERYSGMKYCGGFHPDYGVEWRAGKEVYRALVCFGCGELKMFGPKKRLHCDLSREGKEGLRKTLEGYRKHRPTPKK
jgi:hypothetical protein